MKSPLRPLLFNELKMVRFRDGTLSKLNEIANKQIVEVRLIRRKKTAGELIREIVEDYLKNHEAKND
jgi:hypothetical protein